MTVELKPGWLEKQIEETQAEVKRWPQQFQVASSQAGTLPAASANDTPAECTDSPARSETK